MFKFWIAAQWVSARVTSPKISAKAFGHEATLSGRS
jgi:hypothetical protein